MRNSHGYSTGLSSKPTEQPAKGMVWVQTKGGPRDGRWVQRPKQ